jgi:hypothetical protein
VIAFLDASALIYRLEGKQPWADAVKTRLRVLAAQDAEAGSTTALGLSRLSWLECRVGPLRRQDQAALQRFDGFFVRADLCWVELSAAVVEQATSAARPITGDSVFARVPGLPVVWRRPKGRIPAADHAGGELPGQWLGPAGHARERVGVVPRPLAREL